MAKKAYGIDYAERLVQLRDLYVNFTVSQRYRIILERIDDDPANVPNKLVTLVSAVEGFARCLLIHKYGASNDARVVAYERLRFAKVKDMVPEILRGYGITDPSTHFGEDTYELLGYAVDYRNMLTHDCTYLGMDKYPSMIQACQEVLEELARLAKAKP